MFKKCEYCGKEFEIKISTRGKRKGKPIKLHENKRFCSFLCLNNWQKNTSWEEIVGNETAERIRNERSKQSSGDKNPSKNPEVAKKISESLKKYLKENPRIGEKNPFYGKKHTEEYKIRASESKKGKKSYNEEQYKKQNKNTLKKENHPAWKGGISYEPYNENFDIELKNKIKNRDNFKCQLCMKEYNILHIHHIDYNKKNSNEKNLIVLCNSCHSKTNYKRKEYEKYFNIIIEEKYKEEKYL